MARVEWHARRDSRPARFHLTDLVGRFPRADLVVEGEGHLIPVEEPMTVAAIVAGVY